MKKSQFFPNQTKFNIHNALFLAEASSLAYESPRVSEAALKKKGFSDFEFFENNETQAFITSDDRSIILAFRGTEVKKLKDITTDLDARKTKFPFGKVHLGFSRALNAVWKDIKKALMREQESSKPIFVTGHSLGGALANLAVARIINEGLIKTNGLYTYGQPRVGDKDFADKFDSVFKSRTFRFQNNEDAVPLVPWASGYKHVGHCMYFDTFGNLKKDPKLIFRRLEQGLNIAVRSIDLSGAIKRLLPNALDDHETARYIKRIKKNMNKSM